MRHFGMVNGAHAYRVIKVGRQKLRRVIVQRLYRFSPVNTWLMPDENEPALTAITTVTVCSKAICISVRNANRAEKFRSLFASVYRCSACKSRPAVVRKSTIALPASSLLMHWKRVNLARRILKQLAVQHLYYTFVSCPASNSNINQCLPHHDDPFLLSNDNFCIHGVISCPTYWS